MTDLYVVGAGGFGRMVAQIVQDMNEDRQQFTLAGFIDDAPTPENEQAANELGIPIIGGIETLRDRTGEFALAVGSGAARRALAERVRPTGLSPATLVHPTAQVGATSELGPGAILSLGAMVTSRARTGQFCLHNIYSLTNHDCRLADYVTLSPYATALGGAVCGEASWLSTRSTLNVLTTLGAGSVLAAHAFALHDVPPGVVAKGIPATWTTPEETS